MIEVKGKSSGRNLKAAVDKVVDRLLALSKEDLDARLEKHASGDIAQVLLETDAVTGASLSLDFSPAQSPSIAAGELLTQMTYTDEGTYISFTASGSAAYTYEYLVSAQATPGRVVYPLDSEEERLAA